MNVSTLTMPQEVALQKLEQYQMIPQTKRTPEDIALIRVFRAASKGSRVINIIDAFRQTGLNEKGQPKLAIARADLSTIFFEKQASFKSGLGWRDSFTNSRTWRDRSKPASVFLPIDAFVPEDRRGEITSKTLASAVPHIPADLRPKHKLENYHILFEVQSWEEYNRDPFLLKRIIGNLFEVLAEWDLTELEASLLASMRVM